MAQAPHPLLAQAMHAASRNDLPRAIDLLARVLKAEPRDAALWFNRAVMLQQLARYDEAIKDYDRAVALQPHDADAWFNRAVACDALKRWDDAVISYDHVLRLRARHVGALNNRGVALAALERHEEALASLEAALALNPRDVKALYNSAKALVALDRLDEGLLAYDRALAINPAHGDAWNNRGVLLEMLERNEEAVRSYQQAIRVGGETAKLWLNVSSASMSQNKAADSLAACDAGLRLEPQSPIVRFGKAITLLTLERYDEAWPLYEERWYNEGAPSRPRDVAAPLWLGIEDIAGKTIVLHGEQGFGDVLEFARYAAPVAARGARVIMRVQPELKALFAEGLRGPVESVVSYDDPVPIADFCTPVMSMPLAFGTRIETIPSTVPYIDPNPARVAAWRAKLPQTTKPRIAIVWRGDSSTRERARRAMTLSTFAGLFDASAQFISLQAKLTGEAEIALLGQHNVLRFEDQLKDFSETAALMACCDLVVTIDTSVAHLAGALGMPVWIMLRHWGDWRWLLDREDSPWLPTARLFRQPKPGDWDSVIKQVRPALAAWIAAR
jgi:tetratricopeptide (TPR) repeat protein